MSSLSDGKYLLTDVKWRREGHDAGLRPLHGLTTGHLTVDGGTARVEARFNDLFLSNRFSDMEEDGVPVTLSVAVIETDERYTISCSAPTLDRSGASYKLKAEGDIQTDEDQPSVA